MGKSDAAGWIVLAAESPHTNEWRLVVVVALRTAEHSRLAHANGGLFLSCGRLSVHIHTACTCRAYIIHRREQVASDRCAVRKGCVLPVQSTYRSACNLCCIWSQEMHTCSSKVVVGYSSVRESASQHSVVHVLQYSMLVQHLAFHATAVRGEGYPLDTGRQTAVLPFSERVYVHMHRTNGEAAVPCFRNGQAVRKCMIV